MCCSPPTFASSARRCPYLRQSEGGRIVNIASTEGLGRHEELEPVHPAAKHGVIGLTRSLAVEFGTEDITVNCVCPGPIRTGLTESIPEADKREFARRRVALKRYAEPEEVAHATLSLVLPAAQYITGVAFARGWRSNNQERLKRDLEVVAMSEPTDCRTTCPGLRRGPIASPSTGLTGSRAAISTTGCARTATVPYAPIRMPGSGCWTSLPFPWISCRRSISTAADGVHIDWPPHDAPCDGTFYSWSWLDAHCSERSARLARKKRPRPGPTTSSTRSPCRWTTRMSWQAMRVFSNSSPTWRRTEWVS